MNNIRLRLLGPFEARAGDDSLIDVPSHKGRALLGLLGVRPGVATSRQKLAEVLWERSGEAQARASLRQALSVLNRTFAPFGKDWLIREGELLTLDPDVVDVDVPAFERDCRSTDPAIHERAIALWRGDFLESLRVREPAIENWLGAEQRRLRSMLDKSLQKLLDSYMASERHEEAVAVAQRLEALDPLREDVHRILMQSFARLGRRRDFLAQYRRCCGALADHDVGPPEAKTVRLFESLRDGIHAGVITGGSQVDPVEPPAAVNTPRIAVLCFGDTSGDRTEGVLSVALAESIVIELRRFQQFSVISVNSSLAIHGRVTDAAEAARILGVGYVVTGSIWRSDKRVQITVELVEAQSNRVIWAEHYRRRLDDLFAIQQEVARDIAGAIEPEAMRQELKRASRLPPQSRGAWELLLQGHRYLYRQVGKGWNDFHAQDLFKRALMLDRDYAPAYASLAYSLCLKVKEDLAEDKTAVTDEMRELAEHAVQLDDQDSWNYVVLGRALQQREEYDDAIAAYRQAVALCPSSAKAHFGLSYGLSAVGCYGEAVGAAERASRLSPRDPMAWIFSLVKAIALIYDERFDQAASSSNLARQSPLANHWAFTFEAASLANLGRRDEAREIVRRATRIKPGLTTEMVERAFPVKNAFCTLPVRDGLIEAGLPE